jgi:toluene monooxygenase system protein A
LRQKYPESWDELEPIWQQLTRRWKRAGPDFEWYSHGATPVAFCGLCQLVLCGGSPENNSARVIDHGGIRRIFCSEPCAWIFEREPERYAQHKDVVARILAGEAPGNLMELVRKYFGLTADEWGKDTAAGRYPWLEEDD